MKQHRDTYTSVWDARADTLEQAANLRARADLMRQIAGLIQAKGWKQVEAADRCGVTQPASTTCCVVGCRGFPWTPSPTSPPRWAGG